MNPLSSFTYYRRHKRSVLLLIGVVALVTLGVHMMVSVIDSAIEYAYYRHHYLTRLSQVSAEGGLDPEIIARIRAHPDTAHVIPENGMVIGAPAVGIPILFPALGVAETDLPVVMAACDLRLKEGRLIEPRTAEIVLSEELARALDLRIGDQISRASDELYYGAFVTELTVVGILESVPSTTFPSASLPSASLGTGGTGGTGPSDVAPSVRAAFVSHEYIASHELYGLRPLSLLVIPHEGRKAAMDDFLETLVANPGGSLHIHVKTYESETESLARVQQGSYALYGFVDCFLAGTATLAVAAVNQISITRRLPELGLLHALGYRKRRLIRRLVLEVAVVAGSGWGTGVDSPQVAVETFNTTYQFARDAERDLFLFYAVAEAIVAVAAAVALAVLHYIFFVQRREEFGVLHAVGHSRTWLVLRALRESVSVVSVAWVIGAALCVAGLLYAQANVYAPKGVSINLYNPWPWLFTLPIPLAVVAASVGTIAWMLSRLDPVSVIERR